MINEKFRERVPAWQVIIVIYKNMLINCRQNLRNDKCHSAVI
jgi:hypothetical protein